MSFKFFGQFLLERGKIIREELLDALKFQKEVNVKLGTIALDAGYLTAEQLQQIQLRQQQSDKLFGEIAVQCNYISQKQLEELLMIQKNERMSLGEALVQKGYLTLAGLAQELAEYKKSQEGVSDQVYEVVKKSVDSIIPETFIDITIKLFRRIVDTDLVIIDSHNNRDRISPHLWNVYQNFNGDSCGLLILSISDPIFLLIASRIAQEKIWEIDAFAKDGVKEFVNYVMGNGVAKLSESNYRLSLQPPQIVTSLGKIDVPAKSSEVISVKLASPEFDLPNETIHVSLIYSSKQ